MASSTTITDEALLQDPVLQKRIADLAKFGISWTPPSQRPAAPKVEEPAPVSLTAPAPTATVPKRPKHPRKKAPTVDVPSEPESESEMMGSAYQDAAAAAKKQQNAHLAQGVGISRTAAQKLDDEAFADPGLKMGDNALKREQFVPWRFLIRYGVSPDFVHWCPKHPFLDPSTETRPLD